jgi:outer membrane protein OmpA-like peptidoglycan-associated protein
MKSFWLVIFFLVVLVGQPALAQGPASPGNYVVVVGAFAQPANATKFSRLVKQQKLKPFLEINKEKNVQYIYVMETNNHDEAIAAAKRLQDAGPFRDAWVYSRGLIVEQPPVVEEKKQEVKVEPIVIVEPVKEEPPPVDSAKLKEEILKKKVDNSKMATKKGEMEKLDNIFFYKDASVLRPESRYAVDRLVMLMKQNPTQHIKIHGHTNGNEPGKIIRHAKTDFFSLENTIEDYGSAKELSEERANVIRDYLVANGIDKKRMTVKAWGGKKPLYKVDDDRATANVRVEIEVIKE